VKPSRPLLIVGVSDPQAVGNYAGHAKEIGVDVHAAGSTDEAEQWLESCDPAAIAIDMRSEGAELCCFRIRGMSRLAYVPIIGLAPNLNDLVFAEMYGWGGDDVIRASSSFDLVQRLRGLADDRSPQASANRGCAVVADTDRRRRALYARVLRNAGYDVRFAIEPEEARAESVALGVRLVIADAEIGEDGGAELAKSIRADGSEVPIVIASAPKKMAALKASASGISKVAVTDGFAPPENLLFVANDLARSGEADGRASARLLYGTAVAFRLAGRDRDLFGCSYNISAGGLYVRTLAPLGEGDELWIELIPPRSDRRVRLESKVVWQRRFGPIGSATVPPGFGVCISDGTKGDMSRYDAGYLAFAADTLGA
jgi:CheY-like chemotaxis protein/Tfp pilus assembly protein PilZ